MNLRVVSRWRSPAFSVSLPLLAQFSAYFSSLPSSDCLIIGQSTSPWIGFTPYNRPRPTSKVGYYKRGDMLMYNDPGSSQNQKESASNSGNVWTALANTEKWITDITAGDSPFARKEISYVCETSESTEEVIGTIFRRLREMREIGDIHGKREEKLLASKGSKYKTKTLRQNLMMVISSSQEDFSDFKRFDHIVEVINMARRNARDLIIDPPKNDEVRSEEWVTSISMGHMHPKYGEDEMKSVVAEAEKEKNKNGDEIIIPELGVYRVKRLMARRSPYPSLVLEVRCTPYSKMEESTVPPMVSKQIKAPYNEESDVTRSDIANLEALFGKSAIFDHENDEEAKDDSSEDMWDALVETDGIDQLTFETPADLGLKWITKNDPTYDALSSSFVNTDLRHIDDAYEFIFSTIAADQRIVTPTTTKQTYVIMPNFLSTSATSFEKFSNEVKRITGTISSISSGLEISIFHKENIHKEERSPIPIFAIKWNGK